MELELDKAYETSDGSLVLITKAIGNLFEGIVIGVDQYGFIKYKKYRKYEKNGKKVGFKCTSKVDGWDIVKQIDKAKIDTLLRHAK